MSLATEIIYGTQKSVKHFIDADPEVNVNEVDEYGFNPLIEAAIANKADIAALLIEYGAVIDQPDTTGRTALHWAVDNHNIPLCRLLLENKANPNSYTAGGQPILVYPLLRKQQAVKKLLYQYRADLNFAQDFINAKLLAHRYQLLGQVDIVNSTGQFIELDLEGFFLECTLGIVQNSLERYRNNFAARKMREYFGYLGKIIDSFTNASNLLRFQRYTIDIREHADKIDGLLDHDLLLLPIAYEGHAVTFIKYGNLLIRCDRGVYSKVEGSVVVYQINNLHAFNKNFLKHILYKPQSEEFINTGIKEILGLVAVTTLPLPSQITGNCSWANVEASIPAMLFLLMLGRKSKAREIMQYKKSAMAFHWQWLEWDKDRALEECIESFARASKARKASKAALLGAILVQQCNYDIHKDVERAERMMPILMLPEYQYVLKSYLKIYWQQRQTLAGKNLIQILDMCGVKVS